MQPRPPSICSRNESHQQHRYARDQPTIHLLSVLPAVSEKRKIAEHVASFYLDPYSRPENKRGGAWMDVCVGRSKALGRSPVAYLTCNGSPPVGETPSLMTFREASLCFVCLYVRVLFAMCVCCVCVEVLSFRCVWTRALEYSCCFYLLEDRKSVV